MTPLVLGLGVPELLIILAGIGKSTGRAIKEFKEETRGLRESDATNTEPDASRPRTQELHAPYPPYPDSSQDTAPNPTPGEPRRDA